MFEIVGIVVVSVLALVGAAGQIIAIITMARANLRLSDKVIANSDFQLKRIELEVLPQAVDKYVGAARQSQSKPAAQDWEGADTIPDRSQIA